MNSIEERVRRALDAEVGRRIVDVDRAWSEQVRRRAHTTRGRQRLTAGAVALAAVAAVITGAVLLPSGPRPEARIGPATGEGPRPDAPTPVPPAPVPSAPLPPTPLPPGRSPGEGSDIAVTPPQWPNARAATPHPLPADLARLPVPAYAPPCRAAQLSLRQGAADSVLGNPSVVVVATDVDTAACSLAGYPGVTWGEPPRTRLTVSYANTMLYADPGPAGLVLGAGRSASLALGFYSGAVGLHPRSDACRAVTGLRFRVSAGADDVPVSLPGQGGDGIIICDTNLSVTGWTAGALARSVAPLPSATGPARPCAYLQGVRTALLHVGGFVLMTVRVLNRGPDPCVVTAPDRATIIDELGEQPTTVERDHTVGADRTMLGPGDVTFLDVTWDETHRPGPCSAGTALNLGSSAGQGVGVQAGQRSSPSDRAPVRACGGGLLRLSGLHP